MVEGLREVLVVLVVTRHTYQNRDVVHFLRRWLDCGRPWVLLYNEASGDEDDKYIAQMQLPIFRQVRVKQGTGPIELGKIVAPHLDADRIVILDHYSEVSYGGSGLSFEWAAAEGVANRDRVMLAGGLTPENVGSAIARLSPWGVDVASGVETDGVKDPDRIRAFISAVQNA